MKWENFIKREKGVRNVRRRLGVLRAAVSIFFFGAFQVSNCHSAEVSFASDLWTLYDSNASNSDASEDREADVFSGGQFIAETGGPVGRDWRWRTDVTVEGELAFRFEKLSYIQAGTSAGIERKFGLGWQAPRLHLRSRRHGPLVNQGRRRCG